MQKPENECVLAYDPNTAAHTKLRARSNFFGDVRAFWACFPRIHGATGEGGGGREEGYLFRAVCVFGYCLAVGASYNFNREALFSGMN